MFFICLCRSTYNTLSQTKMKWWQVSYHIITEPPSSITTLQLALIINLCAIHIVTSYTIPRQTQIFSTRDKRESSVAFARTKACILKLVTFSSYLARVDILFAGKLIILTQFITDLIYHYNVIIVLLLLCLLFPYWNLFFIAQLLK